MIMSDDITKNGWSDPDDAPSLTRDWFEQADFYDGGKLVRRGRPKLEKTKQQISIRLDPDLIERLKASGPGWQSRVNDILRKAVQI
jgi:uncharacterized protein (DUF4415 family)